MGKSSRLRLGDVRRVFRLLGDCRDLGDDRRAWVRRAVVGLRAEFSAYMVVEVPLGAPPAVGDAAATVREAADDRRGIDVGWESERDREEWFRQLTSGRLALSKTVPAVLGLPPLPVVVRSRDQLVPDREWRGSAERNEDRLPLHQDETLVGLHRHAPGALSVFSVNRAKGDRGFGGRERAFLRLFLREVNGLAGSHLAVADGGPFADLTPRAREVLAALAEGDSEKQVAARLGLSRHTVHDRIQALYRRFGVRSRGELIALFYRATRPRRGD